METVTTAESRSDAAATAAGISAKQSVPSSTGLEGKTAGLSVLADLPYPLPLAAEQRFAQLQSISATVAACTRCPELCRRRTQRCSAPVRSNREFVFWAKQPGADEDRIGIPFVGAAGQLLDKILTASQLAVIKSTS